MAFLRYTPPLSHRNWIAPAYPSYAPGEDTYAKQARPRVGATAADLGAQGVAKADAYTYGAASAALAEGQAAQAWNELKKQQNYPAVKAIAATHPCPPGWLVSPEGTTCVNQDNVHIAQGSNPGDWWWNAALSSYLRLNEEGAWQSSSAAADACLRGLRAMRMTTGSFGWSNVRSELRGAAQMLIHTSDAIREQYDGDVDAFAFELEKSIGPLYDKDQANTGEATKKSDAIITDLIKSAYAKTRAAKTPSIGLLTALAGAAALGLYAAYNPSGAAALARGAGSKVYQGGAAAVRKVRGIV